MRHGKKFNHLGRKVQHRKAMLSNMAGSLIEHKRIFTTVAKAKALRIYVEPILTKAKTDTMHSRRIVFSFLKNKVLIKELFENVAAKIADRAGGYTRILKTGNRYGDNAEMCMIELVDYNENMLDTSPASAEKKKRVRRGSGGKKQQSQPQVSETDISQATEKKDVDTKNITKQVKTQPPKEVSSGTSASDNKKQKGKEDKTKPANDKNADASASK